MLKQGTCCCNGGGLDSNATAPRLALDSHCWLTAKDPSCRKALKLTVMPLPAAAVNGSLDGGAAAARAKVDDNEGDIFGDAGTDYVCELPQVQLHSLRLQCTVTIACDTCRHLSALAAAHASSRLQHSFSLVHAVCPECLLHAMSVPPSQHAAYAAVFPCLQRHGGDSAAPSIKPESSYFGDKADGMEDLPPLPKDTGAAAQPWYPSSPQVTNTCPACQKRKALSRG